MPQAREEGMHMAENFGISGLKEVGFTWGQAWKAVKDQDSCEG